MIGYLDRDLIRSYLVTFFLLLLFVQVGVFISVVLEKFAEATAAENRLGWVMLYYGLSLPRNITNTIPICAAVATLWVFTVKARQNEVLACLAGGLSPFRLARPIFVVALVLSGTTYFVNELVAIRSEAAAERVNRVNIQGRSLDTLVRENNVFQKGGIGNRFYSIKQFYPSEGRMEMVTIFDNGGAGDAMNQPRWQLDADQATLITVNGQEQWQFVNPVFREFSSEGNVTNFISMDLATESEILPIRLEQELIDMIRQRIRPSQMNLFELISMKRLNELQGRPTGELSLFIHFNIAQAFSCLILCMLMIGHILRPSSAGVFMGFGGGLILIAAYYILFLFGREASKVGAFPAWLSMHGLNILFLLVSIYLLKLRRTS